MTAIEQAKKNIARAEELAQAVKDGKMVECIQDGCTMGNLNVTADNFFASISAGITHRIIDKPDDLKPCSVEE